MQTISSIINTIKFSKNEDFIYLNEERALLVPLVSLNSFQQEIARNIGEARAKKLIFQFGWSIGETMTNSIDKKGQEVVSQLLNHLHTHDILGQFTVSVEEHDIQFENNRMETFYIKGNFKKYDSKELEKNRYLALGYLSGFISKLIGKDVIVTEQSSNSLSDEDCSWEGMLLENCKRQQSLLKTELPLFEELEKTNKELEKEHEQLQLVTDVHNALTEELIRTNDLTKILKVLKGYIDLPIIIENENGLISAYKNINEIEIPNVQKVFHSKLKQWQITKTEFLKFPNHSRLVSPIFVQKKIIGYCSFIYFQQDRIPVSKEKMILGRLTSISTLVYLMNKAAIDANERTKGILFEKILAGEFETNEQIIRELKLLNIELTGYFHLAFLSLKYKGFKDENLSMFTSIYEEVIQFFHEKNTEVLLLQRANGILCFIPGHGDDEKFRSGPIPFYNQIKRKFPKIQCHIGISSSKNDLHQMSSCIEEAITAARFTSENEPILYFKDLGILGILIHSQEEKALKKLAQMELGSIYGDTPQHLEYLETLYQFLLNGGNLEKTSSDLMLSISGLRYRMAKIRELLNDDLKDSDKQFQLLLALKALKVIGEF